MIDGAIRGAGHAPRGDRPEAHDPDTGIQQPALPQTLEEVTIRGLSVGQGPVDLLIRRYERDVGVDVLDRVGQVTVEVLK